MHALDILLLLLCYENNISCGRPEKNEWICFGWKTLRWKAANGILGTVFLFLWKFYHCKNDNACVSKYLNIYPEDSIIKIPGKIGTTFGVVYAFPLCKIRFSLVNVLILQSLFLF